MTTSCGRASRRVLYVHDDRKYAIGRIFSTAFVLYG